MDIRIDYWYSENKIPVKVIKKKKPFKGNCLECNKTLIKKMPHSLCSECHGYVFSDFEYENSLNKNILETYERKQIWNEN